MLLIVIDDDVDAPAMLVMAMQAAGSRLSANRQTYRRRGAQGDPLVCLRDIGTPDMDGNERALRLRFAVASAVLG